MIHGQSFFRTVGFAGEQRPCFATKTNVLRADYSYKRISLVNNNAVSFLREVNMGRVTDVT